MTKLRKFSILILVGLLPCAEAADVQSQTKAEVLEADGRTALTVVDAVLQIALEQPPILTRDDVIVTWRRVGGVQPTPFSVAIPAGCFVEARGRFRVNDTGCGVQITLDGTRVTADTFAARLYPPEPVMPEEPYRLRVRLELAQDAATAAGLLSTLGGATVSVQVGAERGVSPASEIQSKSGIDPTPF